MGSSGGDGVHLRVVGPLAPARVAPIREALEHAAVALGGDAADLVLFANADASVIETVRALSGRPGRTLAIAADAISPGYAWELLAAGSSDVIAWDQSATPALDVAARLERWAEVDRLLASPAVADALVGQSPAWRRVLRQVVEVARFTDASILITGESGTGKELVARLIHSLDGRMERGSLVVLDCTTIVPTLSGSEFFGHERGAFTGAITARDGAFALADGGTLFLDEIGELPLTLQAELLRVVQEGTYKRVGSNVWRRANFRLVTATNRDLVADTKAGSFRADFYHRIAAWTCRLPSLRERPEDVPLLMRYFLREALGREAPALDDAVRAHLMTRDYRGNVRELRNLVLRIAYRHVGPGPITPGDLPEDERTRAAEQPDWRDAEFDRTIRRAIAAGAGLRELTTAAAEAAIRAALDQESGSVSRASHRLRVTERALQLRRAGQRGRGPGARHAREAGSTL